MTTDQVTAEVRDELYAEWLESMPDDFRADYLAEVAASAADSEPVAV